jgi:hypothetical protein
MKLVVVDRRARCPISTLVVVAMFLAATGASAAPITYEVHRSMLEEWVVPGCWDRTPPEQCKELLLDGTITTDGYVGEWTENHFVSIDLTIAVSTIGSGGVVTAEGPIDSYVVDPWHEEWGWLQLSTTAEDMIFSVGYPGFGRFEGANGYWTLCYYTVAACMEVASLHLTGGGSGSTGYPDFPLVIGTVIPEPSTALLVGAGLFAVGARRRKRGVARDAQLHPTHPRVRARVPFSVRSAV